MATKTEQVLLALLALLNTITGPTVARNEAVPQRIPSGGLLVLRDGDPGEPERVLGGVPNLYYTHEIDVEVYVQSGVAATRDSAMDTLLTAIDTKLAANLTLGGLVYGMTYSRPANGVEGVEGAPTIKSCSISITVDYESSTSI